QVLAEAAEGLLGVLALRRQRRLLAEGDLRAQPVRDVAQVAQGGREVPLLDVGGQIARLARAHRLEEVGEVVRAAVEVRDLLPLEIEERAAAVAVADGVALAAVEDVADLGALEV